MKTAIILNGFVRTWDRVINNFIQTFAYMEPHVFVTTYNKQYGYHPHIKNLTGMQDDNILSNEHILSLFEPINPRSIIIEDAILIDKLLEDEEPKMAQSMRGITNGLGQFRKLYLVCQEIEEYENKNNIKFDRIIKTRCDMVYPDIINFDINYNDVLIDNGNVFPNDCFFMAYRDNFMNISSHCFNQFYNPLSNSHEAPPHQLLKNAFDMSGVNIVQRKVMKSVMRVNGEQFY